MKRQHLTPQTLGELIAAANDKWNPVEAGFRLQQMFRSRRVVYRRR